MNRPPAKSERAARHVRIPGFVADRDVGLGDVLKRITATVGIRPCSGCERRAATLNSWMVFRGRQRP
jgi:hypothetical protein